MSQRNTDTNNLGNNDKTIQKSESKLRLMESYDKSQLNQPGSSKDRLHEKKNTVEDEIAPNNDDINRVISKRNFYKRSASPSADDSLADFKLPKLAPKPHPLNNKIKLSSDKTSSSRAGGGGGKKRAVKRRKSVDKIATLNQPSIQSSFFKPPAAFLCPLCMKSFNDVNAQLMHSKNCATKNHVSTKKLLAAVELQERQAEERVAIGLPAAPFQQPRRKSFNIKKMGSERDPDIQLAMALSKSLREIEEKEYFDEALALAAESNEEILQMSSSQRHSTLQSFGFSSNKPIVDSAIDKPRRRKNFAPTILQTRSQETRERLLSDRIAEILVGNESITQSQSLENVNFEILSLCSDVLKKIHKPNSKLWNHSLNTTEHSAYYVEDLCEFILPIDKSETKLNDRNDDEVEITVEKSPVKMESIDQSANNIENKSNDSLLQSQMNQLTTLVDANNENHHSLALSWSKMVNSCAYSDVIILVENNEFIYCHEIVLFTRCENIQKDLVPNNENLQSRQRKKIHWLDINFSSAIAFLKFIYCGEINFEILENDEILMLQVYKLAAKYKVNELLNYLNEKMEKVNNKSIFEVKETIFTPETEQSHDNNEFNSPSSSQSSINQSKLRIQTSEEKNTSQLLNKSINVSHQLHYSRTSISPDMFEDMDMSCNVFSNTGRKINENDNEQTLDVSIKLVNENDSSEIRAEMEIHDDSCEKLCETPKRYLRLSSTCPTTSTASNIVSYNGNKNGGILELNSTMKRTKSNMSVFIENIRKKNAKGILDSDSDSEMSVQNLAKYRKNPFIVKNHDDNSLFTGKYNVRCSKNEEKSSFHQFYDQNNEKKSALSLLEDDIRARAAKSPIKFVASENNYSDSSDSELTNEDEKENSNIFSNAETDDENESMFTKYKRTHRKNSIGNYRDILKSFMPSNPEHEDKMLINIDNSEDKDKYNKTNTTNKHEISAINKIRLAELSAFDIYDAMTPSPPNSSLEDSSKTKTSSSSKSPIDLTELSDEEKLSFNESVCGNEMSRVVEKTCKNKCREINSSECSNDELEFGNWSEEIAESNDWQPLTQSRFENKSPCKNFDANQDKQNNLSQSSLDAAQSIDLTQSDDEENMKGDNVPINQTNDTITENVTKILKDYGLLDSTTVDVISKDVEKINDSKPIVLSSSSETESVAGDTNNVLDNIDFNVENENFHEFTVESDFENNFMQYIIEGGADSANSPPSWNKFQRPSTSKLSINEKNVTFRSKQSTKLTSTSIRRSIHGISGNSHDNELLKISLNTPSPNRSRCLSVSPRKNDKSTRLLTTKSRSEGNFTTFESNIKNNGDNLITCSNQLLSHLNLSSDDCEISFDILPRENYNDMSSLELNQRLADYGLKNQERHRAVKLLNYIYDQLHPLVPERLLTSHHKKDRSVMINQHIACNDDDDDKYNESLSESDNEVSDNSSVSNSSVIADEMMNLSDEDEEYDEKDVILMREHFQKLLDTDRILHNKVLRYEPIPLESIHEKLKDKGIKSGLQVLADYLDDECITFFIEFPKKRQRQIGKPKTKKK